MTKTEFFNIIRNGLKDFPENEVNDILYDYEEHFASGLNDGKTVEEIIEEQERVEAQVNAFRRMYNFWVKGEM